MPLHTFGNRRRNNSKRPMSSMSLEPSFIIHKHRNLLENMKLWILGKQDLGEQANKIEQRRVLPEIRVSQGEYEAKMPLPEKTTTPAKIGEIQKIGPPNTAEVHHGELLVLPAKHRKPAEEMVRKETQEAADSGKKRMKQKNVKVTEKSSAITRKIPEILNVGAESKAATKGIDKTKGRRVKRVVMGGTAPMATEYPPPKEPRAATVGRPKVTTKKVPIPAAPTLVIPTAPVLSIQSRSSVSADVAKQKRKVGKHSTAP